MEKEKLPEHVAVIPDGNRRWARERGLIPREGHREGAKRCREISEAAFRLGIPYFTFWVASEDNLIKRSKAEVKFLVSILKEALGNKNLFEGLKRYDARLRVIGKWNEILQDKKLAQMITELEEKTCAFSKHRITVLFGYDGRREMLEAINRLRTPQLVPERSRGDTKGMPSISSDSNLNFDNVKEALWTGDLPPVDLVIRTGGEPHWSAGFMMWLTADSQLYFTEKYWPEFDEKEFKKALEDYARRERRFGK